MNPNEVNAALDLTENMDKIAEATIETTPSPETGNFSTVDTDGNGQVTIQDTKDADFAMPITDYYWPYLHMRSNDYSGIVGE